MSKQILTTLLLTGCFSYCFSQPANSSLPRKNCFFGVHFDFHALPSDNAIGKTVTTGMIDSLLDEVKPDFVQIDCKGQHGIASYPTKVGTPAGGFIKDALRLWRDETAKKGIGLYVHYSDLVDEAALQRHPGWAALNADKAPGAGRVSIFSNYEDSLLIPQLKEVIKQYNIDGIWVDNETYAIQPDYSNEAIKAFAVKTNITSVPTDKSSNGYNAFLQFERNAFAQYISKYATALHQVKQNIQIGSNWTYSAVAPLPVATGIDFLSGDMPSNQYDLSRVAFAARCFSSQAGRYKKAWDLMSWGFDDHGIRTVDALCQEAAEVISMGGAWQCYFPQNHDASISSKYVDVLKGIAPFVRARQSYCQYATPVKQIAVLFSGDTQYGKNTRLFQDDNNTTVRNALYSLLNSQLPAEVIMEHQFNDAITSYPLIVVPELGIAKNFKSKLLKYVSNGGTVLLLGTNNISQLGNYGGVTNTSASAPKKNITFQDANVSYQFAIPSYTLQNGTSEIKDTLQIESAGDLPAATVKAYGKGRIACFFIDQKSASNDNMYAAYQKMIAAVAKKLLVNPIVEVSGSANVHVAVSLLQNKTVVNLINTSKAINAHVPELGSLMVKLRLPAKPSKITLQPANQSLSFTYANNICTMLVPKLSIQASIVAE